MKLGIKKVIKTFFSELDSSRLHSFLKTHLESLNKCWKENNEDFLLELADCLSNTNISINEETGDTLLHYAVIHGSEKAIESILERGGDVMLENSRKEIPLEASIKNNTSKFTFYRNCRVVTSLLTLCYGCIDIESSQEVGTRKIYIKINN